MPEIRIKKTTVYKYDELSDTGKGNVLNSLCNINVEHFEWWDGTYDDAAEIGLKITGFDIDRASYCDGEYTEDAEDVAKKIIENHGDTCDTHQTAQNFIDDRSKLVEKFSDGIDKDRVAEDNEYEFDGECDELETEFFRAIREDYRGILQKEYEYRTSEEAIVETIESNEYMFTEDGEIYTD